MNKSQILLNSHQIQVRVKELAQQISKDYLNKDLVLLGVLKGSFIFLSDLVRSLEIDPRIEFISLSSYKNNQSTGEVRLSDFDGNLLKNKDILVVEDIIDTGLTLDFLKQTLSKFDVKSLSICSFLLKEKAQSYQNQVKYIGFHIPDDYIFGYGLDDDGFGRGFSDIYTKSSTIVD